ncbi:nuclear transport factor 2 family protein [Ilumatobacter sp.]|uniref:nuclear transport factor 2 family protein n=1 Tax=Ilumatobacter sp. TaxID=1967498 RepID=UPI003C488218
MSRSTDEFVDSYVEGVGDGEPDLGRIVTEPSGLDAAAMLEALAHPWFTEPGRQPVALQMMADFMAPDDSIYYDAIYGASHGQSAIRNWLIPVMATIDFIEFVPTASPCVFDDGQGGTSLDEWQMVAVFGEDRMPLSRGVSVRRYRDGWITWACDVYDTGPFRVPPAPDAEVDVDAEPLPDWPRTVWHRDHDVAENAVADIDVGADADEFHETDSVYHDPIFGEIRGRAAIRDWLTDVMGKVGNIVFEPLGPELDDGTTTVQEWQQMAVQPDGRRVFMTRGTSVRRRTDGFVTYAADYFDTASLMDPDIQAAALAAGSTLTADDIARYRSS